MRLERPLAAAAGLVLAFAISACGGDDGANGADAPDDASQDEFCEVYNDDSFDEADVDAAHEAADRLAEVGTPEDIDEDARNGFEVFTGFLADVEEEDIDTMESADPSDMQQFADDLGVDEGEAQDMLAFLEYAETTCNA